MILTNKLNLPLALVDAVRNDPYENGGAWRSVTQLIAPPRSTVLKKRHEQELTEDVAERLFALYGQIVHGILERANTINLVEERLFTTFYGKKISGAFDTFTYEDGLLSDWKFSTVWKMRGLGEDWLWQMNLLALLFRLNGKPEVKQMEIIVLGRDHQKRRAKREKGYPPLPVARIPVPLWDLGQQKALLNQRVNLHLAAEEKLPECSPFERWAKPSEYAVMKRGRKSAVKKYDDLEFAKSHIALDPAKYYLEERPGESIRCEDGYCTAAPFCTQYQKIREKLDDGRTA